MELGHIDKKYQTDPEVRTVALHIVMINQRGLANHPIQCRAPCIVSGPNGGVPVVMSLAASMSVDLS